MLNIKLTNNIKKDTDTLLSKLIDGARPTINDAYDTTIETAVIDNYRDGIMRYTNYSIERTLNMCLNCPPSDIKQRLKELINKYTSSNWDKEEATYTITVINALRHIMNRGIWMVGHRDRVRTQLILEWFIVQLEELLEIYVELI